MRDCVFLLADKNMKATFEGFLSRDQFHLSLNCGVFDFDSSQDLVVASGDNDPGLYVRGHELLIPFQKTHQHAVIVLDAEWEGSPEAQKIATDITAHLISSGWNSNNCKVIVIDPELENWIWQRNDHVATALGENSATDFAAVISSDIWPETEAKPSQPKETFEAILKKNRKVRSSAIYKNITSQVSVRQKKGNHGIRK